MGARLCFLVVFTLSLLIHKGANAGGTQSVIYAVGSGGLITNGSYTPNAAGLNTYYAFNVEVVPGTGNLVVEFFDADIGATWDNTVGGAPTAVRYSVLNPGGATINTALINVGAIPGCDNVWCGWNIPNPAVGVWEIRVDMSSAQTTGDRSNGFGVRARDTINGQELNVYASSNIGLGVVPGAVGPTVLHPYVTRACSFEVNDYDVDDQTGGGGSIVLSSPNRDGNGDGTADGVSVTLGTLSGNGVWASNNVGGYANSDDDAVEYGVWTASYNLAIPTGLGANIIETVVGEGLAGPPPTANPDPNAFRLYLPTLAGGVPTKAYVEQFVRRNTGPNPPVVGTVSNATITIKVTNPSSTAITSAALRATVPGGGVTFAGNQVATIGSVTVPGVGGTGTVNWTIGTVPAGGFALLAYDVDILPTSAGQRLVVTGPSATGTQARWLEASTQSVQFGPLCELAVTEASLLDSRLAKFDAKSTSGGKSVVTWATSSQHRTVGFELWGKNGDDLVKVATLPAELSATGGAEYATLANTFEVYQLVEVDDHGARKNLGATHLVGEGATWNSEGSFISENLAERRGRSRLPLAGFGPRSAQRNFLSNSDVGLKIATDKQGIYQVSAAELAEAWGQSEGAVQQDLKNHYVDLRQDGRQVAWRLVNDQMTFYADAESSAYASNKVFTLTRSSGVTMQFSVGSSSSSTPSLQRHMRFEENESLVTAIPAEVGQDLWSWKPYAPLLGAAEFQFELQSVDEASARITISLRGATSGLHEAQINLNGQDLGTIEFRDFESVDGVFEIPESVLQDGSNTLQVGGSTDGMDIAWVDSFELDYMTSSRTFETGAQFEVLGESERDLASELLLNVDDVYAPLMWKRSATLTPGTKYWQQGTAHRASAVWRTTKSQHLQSEGAEYLVLTTSELMSAAQQIAEHREGFGFSTKVIDLEEIFDEINHGQSRISMEGAT